MEVELDQDLLYNSLQYHGPKLQEAFESESGDVEAFTGLSSLSFPAYANGHNTANDLDDEKQSKLHKFIVNHSKTFFNVDLLANIKQKQCEDFEANSYTVMPPYEVFGYTNKEIKLQHFLNELSEGEIIITSISSKTISGLILKVLCTYSEPVRCVSDINVRGFCPASIPALSIGDNLCCEVLEVVPEACKLVCGIKGVKCPKKYKDLLGLFNMDNCPQTFKLFHAGKNEASYDLMLRNSTGFKNPSNICNLELITGLFDDRYSILPALSGSFPEKEMALELRKVQSAQWAIQSVSDGIKHFKAGQHSEAFLCLNKALTIDSLNVEAYVARGALYANLSRFQKAIEDLKSALKINPKHANGRKYLAETLMGYARTLESQNKLEEALQYYEECLQVIPDHDEAKASIEYLKSTLLVGKTASSSIAFENIIKKKVDSDLDFEKSASSSSSSNNSNSSSTDSSSSGSSSDDDSNSSSDSDSDHSSSSDSSSDGSSGNDSQKLEKERSLSPFSKRLAMMDGNNTNGGGLPCNPSFVATENSQPQQLNVEKDNDIEGRIQKLLILSQTSKGKKNKQIAINLQKLLQEACALKNEEKKLEKKTKKVKEKKKSHKHKKKDSKNKQKVAKDQEHHHKKNKSKKHKLNDQPIENELQIAQKSSLPDPESVKSNLSNLKENIFFKKYIKQDKPNDQNVMVDKENEQSDIFKVNETVEIPSTYKYAEDPSLIPTPKFKMQLPTTTTSFVKPKKKEPVENVPYNWDNSRMPPNHDLMRTQTASNNEANNTEHSFPTSYDTINNKGYYNLPLPTHSIPESNNVNNMEFQQKQSYPSPNNKERSRSRSVSKRRMAYSRSRSSGGRSSQSPFKKKPKEASKSKSRSRSGSYPRHRRYSSSRSNRSRSSSRSYSRSRSRSRSMYHRNRMPYYNNRNRGTYYKPRFQNQNHHNRGFQNRGFQHRGGYVHRQNYNNYNNWNNRGQRGGGRQRFFHYRPRQYDRNRHYERRSYSVSPNRRSRSRSKSRSGSRHSSKEYNRKRYSGSGEDPQHITNNKPKTPPEPATETNKWQLDNTDNNGNRNSHDHDEGSIE